MRILITEEQLKILTELNKGIKIKITKDELIDYLHSGFTISQIVNILKNRGIEVTDRTLRRRCSEFHITELCNKGFKKVDISKEDLENYLNSGFTIDKIAQKLSIGVTTLRRKCEEFGIKKICDKKSKLPDISKEYLENILKDGFNNKLSMEEISDKMGVSSRWLYQKIRDFKINLTDYDRHYKKKSKGEMTLEKILNDFAASGFITDLKITHVKLDGCYGFKCVQNLTTDAKFSHNNKIIYVEVDGAHHFYPKNQTEEEFNNHICNDRLTNKIIVNKNYSLIRTTDKFKIEDFKKFLENAIKKINPGDIILSDDYPKLGWNSESDFEFCLLDINDLKNSVNKKLKKIKTQNDLNNYVDNMKLRLKGEDYLLSVFLKYIEEKNFLRVI